MDAVNFDFVIVGAGSAGCVLANRLSSNGDYRVALVEAGGRDSNPWIHIPVGYFKTMGNSQTDWCYETCADPGLNGRSIDWPRGKVLGGSSSINGLLYVRGQPRDFDIWRQLGNTGWSWEDVLPYFVRAETWHGQPDEGGQRGAGGPLAVSPVRLRRRIVDLWVRVRGQRGLPRESRLQFRRSGRGGRVPADRAEGPSLQRRRCLSPKGRKAAEPGSLHEYAG